MGKSSTFLLKCNICEHFFSNSVIFLSSAERIVAFVERVEVVEMSADAVLAFGVQLERLLHVGECPFLVSAVHLQLSAQLVELCLLVDFERFVECGDGLCVFLLPCMDEGNLFVGMFVEGVQVDDFLVVCDGFVFVAQSLLSFRGKTE